MPKVPSEKYDRILAALFRLGFSVVHQKGSHIRIERRLNERTLKVTVPAHHPVKRSALSHILKQAEVTAEDFTEGAVEPPFADRRIGVCSFSNVMTRGPIAGCGL